MIYDIILVGSGASAISAALGLVENGLKPLILDIGYIPEKTPEIDKNFYDYKKQQNSFDLMIGNNLEGLINFIEKKNLPPKLTAPFNHYIIKESEKLSPLKESHFKVIQSFSRGGLANAWGAGLYRYTQDDLKNIPLNEFDLSPYFDKLTEEIGISGADDDLTKFFGSADLLLKPLNLSEKSARLYAKYQKKRPKMNQKGFFLGRPRLAILSEKYHDRKPYDYQNLDMWLPGLPYIYTPAFSLKKLIKRKKVYYKDFHHVQHWSRDGQDLIIHARDLKNKKEVFFKTRKIILAAGTINTARIVLKSKKDFKTRLDLLDNPLVQIPLIFPAFIGKTMDQKAFGMTNLNMVMQSKRSNQILQGSLIELTSPARFSLYDMFPFPARSTLNLIKNLSPATMVLFLYFPSSQENKGSLHLNPDGTLGIQCPDFKIKKKTIRQVIYAFLSLGILSHPYLVQYSIPGYAVHYAGTLPMSRKPHTRYTCDTKGQLFQEPGIHIVDGSLFSYIGAKNITFTIMANAWRIAEAISKK